MNWFKHSVDSHDDPDISDAEDLFGDAGYTIFFKIIELYAREYNNTNSQGEISFSLGFLRRKLRKSSAKVELILNFYSKKQRIIFRKGDGELIIKIPKFIDILDNWSKRKVTKTTEQLQSNYRATTQPIRREEEKNKEEKKNKDSSKKKKLFTDNGSAIQVPLAKNGSSVSIASSISVSNASSISASKKKKLFKEAVFLTDEEEEKLLTKFGAKFDEALTILNNYKMSTGKTYKSDYHVLIGWVADRVSPVPKPQNLTPQQQEAKDWWSTKEGEWPEEGAEA